MKNDIIVTDGIRNTLMELRTSSNLRANGGMKNDIIVTDGIKNTLTELRASSDLGRTASLSLMELRTSSNLLCVQMVGEEQHHCH